MWCECTCSLLLPLSQRIVTSSSWEQLRTPQPSWPHSNKYNSWPVQFRSLSQIGPAPLLKWFCRYRPDLLYSVDTSVRMTCQITLSYDNISMMVCRKILTKQHVNTSFKNLPKSQHIAGDLCVVVVKTASTHSSPCAVVVDLQTSRVRHCVVTSKSRRHWIHRRVQQT